MFDLVKNVHLALAVRGSVEIIAIGSACARFS